MVIFSQIFYQIAALLAKLGIALLLFLVGLKLDLQLIRTTGAVGVDRAEPESWERQSGQRAIAL